MNRTEIIEDARKYLEQGLYFGNGHITRATDNEIIQFSQSIANKAIMEFVQQIKSLHGVTDRIYVADAVRIAMDMMK